MGSHEREESAQNRSWSECRLIQGFDILHANGKQLRLEILLRDVV